MPLSIREERRRQLLEALRADEAPRRQRAALSIGTMPDPAFIEPLIERCSTEPDFFVRDMLTWALVRHQAETVVPRLLEELRADAVQARSQALHTLSKVGDPSVWSAVPNELLHDADDDIARAAWRAGVALAPPGDRRALAVELVAELGRREWEVQRSLSRALVALAAVSEDLLRTAAAGPDPDASAHARATERLIRDPDGGFALDPDDR